MPDFFSDLKRIAFKEALAELNLLPASGFFSDCDKLIRQETQGKERLERYWDRRKANAIKARRIHARYMRVMNVDPWEWTKDIPPDVFGDNPARIRAIKSISNRKLRIAWCLWAMYHLWMFDQLAPGTKRYGKRYSKYRKLWFQLYEKTQERLKQERWDRKREQVRAKRAKNKYSRKKRKLNADETLERLKASRVQNAIDEMEPIKDLPNI